MTVGLLQAYLSTAYVAFVPGEDELVLRIGQQSDRLAELMRQHSASSTVFITAFNPASVELPVAENLKAQGQLRDALSAIPDVAAVYEGEGRALVGDWPPEPSLLAIGVSFADAGRLAEKFEQAAVVFAGEDAIPRLTAGYVARGEASAHAELIGQQPAGSAWAKTHEALKLFASQRPCEPAMPPVPLILAGAAFSTDIEKATRWAETVRWAVRNGCASLLQAGS